MSFAAIGFFFLLPADVLFSIWFFFLLSRVEQVVATSYNMDHAGDADLPAAAVYRLPDRRRVHGPGGLLFLDRPAAPRGYGRQR